MKRNAHIVYQATLDLLSSIEQHDKVVSFKSAIASRSHDLMEVLRSHESFIRLMNGIDYVRGFVYREGIYSV